MIKLRHSLFYLSLGGITLTSLAQEQLPNSDFEKWEKCSQITIWNSDGPTNGVEPVQWNSFLTAGSFFSSTPTLFMFAQDQLRRSDDVRPGSKGTSSVRIFATEIMSIVANGNLTTGTIHMGDMNASSQSNYNFTDIGSDLIDQGTGIPYNPVDHRAAFTGRPDSVVVWAKFTPVEYGVKEGETVIPNEAQLSFILHDNYSYKEPHATEAEQQDHLIGSAFILTPSTENQWKRFALPISYNDQLRNPAYLLASCTTNKNAGKGKGNDQLWVDDLHFIYNTKLKYVTINGKPLADFEEDTYLYYVAKENGMTPVSGQIEAQAYGSEAIIEKTIAGEEVVLKVTDPTAAGVKTRTYTLRFTEAPAIALQLTITPEVNYNSSIAPTLTGVPAGANVVYEIDRPGLMCEQEGQLKALGCGEVTIRAVYRQEGEPTVYSNSCTVKILPLPLLVKTSDIDYTRGRALPTYKFVYEGLLKEDSLFLSNVFRTAPSATSEVQKNSIPGETFEISLNPGDAYNYKSVAENEKHLVTVLKSTLKITAKNKSRAENEENPEFTCSYSGFISGENASTPGVLKTLPEMTCAATGEAKAGEVYPIVISGATSDLYEITHINGKLTITVANSLGNAQEEQITIKAEEGKIAISGNQSSTLIRIFDITGKQMHQTDEAEFVWYGDIRNNTVYLIAIGNKVHRIMISQ